jgi:hypothetical protein
VYSADAVPGADCGAKINFAEAQLGATSGQIQFSQRCGTSWTTPVVITRWGARKQERTLLLRRLPSAGSGGIGPPNGQSMQEGPGPNLEIQGFDPIGSGFSSYQLSIIGNTFSGHLSGAANTYSDIKCQDCESVAIGLNQFVGAASPTSKCAVEFTETAGGRAQRNIVGLNFANQNYGTGVICDNVTNKSFQFGNPGLAAAFGYALIGPNATFGNTDCLNFLDSGGTMRCMLQLFSNNVLYVMGKTGTNMKRAFLVLALLPLSLFAQIKHDGIDANFHNVSRRDLAGSAG